MKKISDYGLMKKIVEENDEWSKIHLWHRYQPVVNKRATYLMSIVSSHWEKDDLIQEFFLSFLKAVDYIDLEKIPDETFHFGTLYFFFLRKTENRIKNKYFKRLKDEVSYEDIFHPEKDGYSCNDSIIDIRAKETIHNNPVKFDFDDSSILFKSVELPDFRKKLTETQNSILTGILERRKIVDISKSLSQKYSKTYIDVVRIREEAKNHFVGVN